jgi:D5 N terminal like/Primase C terminal 2 (PriCT-2)
MVDKRKRAESGGSLTQFLINHAIKKNSAKTSTHIRIGNRADIYSGKYHIQDGEEYDEFIRLYHAAIADGCDEYLAEQQCALGPIIVDIDLRYSEDVTSKQHSALHIDELVRMYVEELLKMYQIDETHPITCYVTEKSSVVLDNKTHCVKDGIHLLFNIQQRKDCQELLRSRILERIALSPSWSALPIINQWSDVFDLNVSKGTVFWQVYGSKKPDKEAYAITRILDISAEDSDILYITDVFGESDVTDVELLYKMSARSNKYNLEIYFRNDFIDELEEYNGGQQSASSSSSSSSSSASSSASSSSSASAPEHALALAQGGREQFDSQRLNDQFMHIGSREQLEGAREVYLLHLRNNEVYDMIETYSYTMILPASYYEVGTREKWIRVGFALHHTGDCMFFTWVLFSAKQESFSFSEIANLRSQWDSFSRTDNGYTRRSIKYWARDEDDAEFKRVMLDNTDYHINQIYEWAIASERNVKSCNDCDISNLLYFLYRDDHVCSNVRTSTWYTYENHRWFLDDQGTTLLNKISGEFRLLIYRKLLAVNARKGDSSLSEREKKELDAKSTVLGLIIKQSSNNGPKSGIIAEARRTFFNSRFYESLDDNPSLMCFNNGVVDFRTKEFRNGKPEDYLTKCTNTNFITLDRSHQPIVDEINDFMEKLFPDRGLLRYMWDN